jgi:intracellular septation protein
MKLLFDFFPIILFFIAYKMYGIYAATAVAIVASILQVSYSYYKNKKIEKMHLVSMAIILVMGGATLLLHDKSFIMYKPTIINWLFAAGFIISEFIGKKPLIERMLSSHIVLIENKWRVINRLWIGFFIVSGLANLYFVHDYNLVESQLLPLVSGIKDFNVADLNCLALVDESVKNLCDLAKDKEEIWVNFKLFGLLGMTLIFILLQGLYLSKYIQQEDQENK